ncbi:MAG: hypothetical protein ACW96M_08530, partial [Candidatus Thorarchaeota archaeon]
KGDTDSLFDLSDFGFHWISGLGFQPVFNRLRTELRFGCLIGGLFGSGVETPSSGLLETYFTVMLQSDHTPTAKHEEDAH